MTHSRFVRIALGLASVVMACAVTVTPVAADEDGDASKSAPQFTIVTKVGTDGSPVLIRVIRPDPGGIVKPFGVEWT
jgi:hypothetical protein